MNYLYPLTEYLRPWRLLTLMCGLAVLIAGALWSGLPDWDIAISFIMAIPAYLTAGPTMHVFIERRWRYLHYALFWTWFTVDGTYFAYWTFVNPEALQLRYANAAASLALYTACGLVWYRIGPLFSPRYEDDWDYSDEQWFH